MNKVLIIGAGVHGLTISIELAKKGFDVKVIDKNPDIFQGASGGTHNRAHMGYHYPRSISTAKECLKGLMHFETKYPSVIDHNNESFYLIDKESLTDLNTYKNFCNNVGIPGIEEWPEPRFLNRDLIEGSIITREPVFNMTKLKDVLRYEAINYGVKIITNAELISFHNLTKRKYTAQVYFNNNWIYLDVDIIINATYAYSNNIMKILGVEKDMVKYKLQHTEVVVVKSQEKLPSMTIMDGPFVSIMKHGGKENEYLIYDVKNSIHHEEEGYFLTHRKMNTNFNNMLDRLYKYFPFANTLEYIESWWGTRPIPIEAIGDSRNTRIKTHKKNNIYSILEGKLISATLIAEKFAKQLEK